MGTDNTVKQYFNSLDWFEELEFQRKFTRSPKSKFYIDIFRHTSRVVDNDEFWLEQISDDNDVCKLYCGDSEIVRSYIGIVK
jgi:disulfide oxidoreductase YuzD